MKPLDTQSIPLDMRVLAANAGLEYVNCTIAVQLAEEVHWQHNNATTHDALMLAYGAQRVAQNELEQACKAVSAYIAIAGVSA
jgi:hypothetical protein